MSDSKTFSVLSGEGHHPLARHIVRFLNDLGDQKNLEFQHLVIDDFPDHEEDTRIPVFENLEGTHLLLFESIHNKDLMNQFLQLAFACKDQYGVKSITAIISFMRYRRQDHKT